MWIIVKFLKSSLEFCGQFHCVFISSSTFTEVVPVLQFRLTIRLMSEVLQWSYCCSVFEGICSSAGELTNPLLSLVFIYIISLFIFIDLLWCHGDPAHCRGGASVRPHDKKEALKQTNEATSRLWNISASSFVFNVLFMRRSVEVHSVPVLHVQLLSTRTSPNHWGPLRASKNRRGMIMLVIDLCSFDLFGQNWNFNHQTFIMKISTSVLFSFLQLWNCVWIIEV